MNVIGITSSRLHRCWRDQAVVLKTPASGSMSAMAILRQSTSYDVISQQSMGHPDLNELLNALLSMAQMLLTKQGEFLPIGALMLSNGEIRHVGAQIEGTDYPGSQPLIDLLIENFQKEAAKGKLRAAGICYDVLTVPPGKYQKQDTICCGLEHCLGEGVNVFMPYTKTGDGSFEYGETFATKRTPQFFRQTPRA